MTTITELDSFIASEKTAAERALPPVIRTPVGPPAPRSATNGVSQR